VQTKRCCVAVKFLQSWCRCVSIDGLVLVAEIPERARAKLQTHLSLYEPPDHLPVTLDQVVPVPRLYTWAHLSSRDWLEREPG